MKKQIISSVGVFSAAMGPAWADNAELYPSGIPHWDWSGFYVGLNAGYIAGITTPDGYLQAGAVATGTAYCFPEDCSSGNNLAEGGGIFGAQIGYNFQSGNLVYGVEGDFAFTTVSDSDDRILPISGYAFEDKVKLSSFGTARVRVGLTNGPTLVYATGGLAFGDVQDRIHASGFGTNYSWSDEPGFQFGFVVGGGVEHAVGEQITIKAEGLYYDLGSNNHESVNNFIGQYAFSSKFETTGVIGRVGINYHF